MKLNTYSIFDTASGLYSRPFFTSSDAEAMRMFEDLASDAEHPIGKHPEDYSLIRVGMWDDTKGTLTDEENETLCTGLEAVAKTRKIQPRQLDLIDDNRVNPGVNLSS